MVVSGVPQRNGSQHAGEIANMALDLVKVCETFIIPHRPDQKLKIRAGIHSGKKILRRVMQIAMIHKLKACLGKSAVKGIYNSNPQHVKGFEVFKDETLRFKVTLILI